MQRGLNIITPNKKLNSGPLDRYLALRQFQRESYIHYFYEVRSINALSALCSLISAWLVWLVECWSGEVVHIRLLGWPRMNNLFTVCPSRAR